ncbi:MAG TPA: 5-methyltetrahydropteroyltriglutamate--homocysteine S-methyltransferase [Chthoniobacterales bacterium]
MMKLKTTHDANDDFSKKADKMDGKLFTHNLGYPRIGEQRELKKATEAYWNGKISRAELETTGRTLRAAHWAKQKAAGIDLIPCNDFSFYDQVLGLTCLVGNVPPRFEWDCEMVDLDTYFQIARGTGRPGCEHGCSTHGGTFASEMTKWFDTNYHYIVPELRLDTKFRLSSTKIFDELEEAQSLGINAKPVLIGPVTYLTLGKAQEDFDPHTLLDPLVAVYEEILRRLKVLGVEWVQLDEPVLAFDLSDRQLNALKTAYARLAKVGPKMMVATYFGPLRENLPHFLELPVAALHYDAVRGAEDLDRLFTRFPEHKILSLGVVDGRNIWKNDFDSSLAVLDRARKAVGEERLWIAPSCSLQHSPITLKNEPGLDPEFRSWLAFADEKLAEVVALSALTPEALEENRAALASRNQSPRIHDPKVKTRLAAVQNADFERSAPFAQRRKLQREKLKLPSFPTTTIGSFPQTAEIRTARAKWKRGEMQPAAYEAFIKGAIRECVAFQDSIGIDLPVHGEFERNDMVEYFGEQLSGFAFTKNGWVQSYGTRYVKPPILFGDVSRPHPMTVHWSEFAQTLTERPMKGMLTGPVTILQWSFVRDDQPRSETAWQIALAIRDEVIDLEKAGIAAIQIDEPALREGLPLRHADWEHYLDWAVKAFRLCACGVCDDTQIHTHMCYSEFNDIITAIAALDADVITIETSRSNMELLDAFVDFAYPNEIGPGVWDIHSPRVPGVEEMENLLRKAKAVIPPENLWVNPDCGLKTRGWEEVKPALRNMAQAACNLRV